MGGCCYNPSVVVHTRSIYETFLMANQPPGLEDLIRCSERVTEGIPLAELLDVMYALNLGSAEAWKRAGFSRSSIHRRATKALKADEGDRLVRLAKIGRLAIQTLGDPDKAGRWLLLPNRALNGQAPLAMIATSPGAEAVESVLGRISYGVFS